jgi:hypothetical protein
VGPETDERRDVERVWLWCSTCRLEHEAEIWREGRYDYPGMRWLDPNVHAEGARPYA